MRNFSGVRYAYTKTDVAYLVPFVFLVPGGLVFFLIYLLNTRALITGEILTVLTPGARVLVLLLAAIGLFVASDLWRMFRRVMDDEIWITSTEIIWVRGKKVRVRAPLYEVKQLIRRGSQHHDEGWFYTVVTGQGNIRFTRSISNADELLARIESLAAR